MSAPQFSPELQLSAQPGCLCEVRGWVREAAKLAGCDAPLVDDLVLAVNEACMNVIQHAYCFACDQEMLLRIRQEPGAMVFELLDHAKPICTEDVKPRDLDDIRPGGLGVHFIRTIMDEMAFVTPPTGFGNMLRMVKHINDGNQGKDSNGA